MTPAARAQALIEILEEMANSPKPADSLLSSFFRNRRYIGSKDRAQIAERTYGILRHHARLNWHIEKAGAQATPRLRVIAYLLLVERIGLNDVTALFTGEKYAPEPLQTDETAIMKNKLAGQEIEPSIMPLPVRLECPEWATESFQAVFGDDFERIMTAMLQPAELHLRTNALLTDRKRVMDLLTSDKITCHAGQISPLSIIVEGRPPISNSKAFQKGLVEIQDEGSQLIALLCQPKPGDQLVDFCAGAGGKTLALGAMMANKGRIVACDVLGGKLQRAKIRFRRAGLHNIETRALTSENDKWVKRSQETYDVVLADAPCSGAGTWRRNPDMRWRALGLGLETLIPLQQSIMDSASRLVKKGGRFVYATCSLLPDENEKQVARFLEKHPDFKLVPVADIWDEAVGTPLPPRVGDFMAMNPADHGTDGFFAAVMIRL